MSEPFGPGYADSYDATYRDKDYAGECDLLERIFRGHAARPVRSVLDLGCGTGNHAIPLAERGCRVVGVDRSEQMVAHARRKLDALPRPVEVAFRVGDVRTVDVGQHFDAALMMFAVLGYQLTNADVLAALKTARRHLQPGGLLVFDVWYGPAVLHVRPSERIRAIPGEKGQIVRAVASKLDTERHLCQVCYRLWNLQTGGGWSESQEEHWVRYFFPQELDLFLACAGFERVRMGAFPDWGQDVNENTWNVLVVARTIEGTAPWSTP